jgi:hypothetical protein
MIFVGLSNGNILDCTCVGHLPNSYAIHYGYKHYWLSGKIHNWPNEAIEPNGCGDVYGSGLLLNPENELSIFFTGNGILMGQSSPSYIINLTSKWILI